MDRPFLAYSGEDPFIFVSYAHDDADLVYPELLRLHDQGFNIWYDEGISPGATWRDELANRIASSTLFLYFVSPSSADSLNCQQEVNYAIDHGCDILAIHLKPSQLKSGLDLVLSNQQALIKHEMSAAEYEAKLTAAVNAVLRENEPIQHTRIPATRENRSVLIAGLAIAASILIVGVLALLPRETPLPPVAETQPAEVVEIKPGLAVLPFTNMSPIEENAYFADGIHGDIQSALSHIQGLKVISRTSVMGYRDSTTPMREIAEELGVSHVLEGSVRRAGDKVRIIVQLIDASRDEQVWAQTYDRDLTDIFAVQSEVAMAITDQLKLKMDLDVVNRIRLGPTQNMQAYDHYVRARDLMWRGQDYKGAREELNKAIDLDGGFAEAHALIAVLGLWDVQIQSDWQAEREEVFAVAEKAYSLKPESSDVQMAMGFAHLWDGAAESALPYFDRAIQINPNNDWANWGGILASMGQGKIRRAIERYQPLVALDPNSYNTQIGLAAMMPLDHRPQEAAYHLERAARLNPSSGVHRNVALFYANFDRYKALEHLYQAHLLDPTIAVIYRNIASQLFHLGDLKAATVWADSAAAISPNHTSQFVLQSDLYRYQGKREELTELLNNWENYDPENNSYRVARAVYLIQSSMLAVDMEVRVRLLDDAKIHLRDALGDSLDGDTVEISGNMWIVFAYGIANWLSQDPLGEAMFRSLLNYYESEPDHELRSAHTAAIYAFMGKHEQAVLALEGCSEPDQGCATWAVESWAMGRDIDHFPEARDNPRFQQLFDNMKRTDARILQRLRADFPAMFEGS